MLGWVVVGYTLIYAALIMVLTWVSGLAAAREKDARHRRDARDLMKYLIWVMFGGGGLITALVRLHHAGMW